MRLLLLSNSTNVGEPFMKWCENPIKNYLGNQPLHITFIPYAAVTFSFDEYERIVKEKFTEFGYQLTSIHHSSNPIKTIQNTDVIIVGGGNTFHLLKHLQVNRLIECIRNKVVSGTPYIGWSAGSNIACPTICTTNDMPIVETVGFEALNLFPYQINPHYTDLKLSGHGGETRDQRIAEFLIANTTKKVIGLREGTYLKLEDKKIEYFGSDHAKLFQYNKLPLEIKEGQLSF